MMFVAGKRKVLGHLHARPHPRVVKTCPETLGGGPATCDGGLAAADVAASCAPAKPEEERSNKRADGEQGSTENTTQKKREGKEQHRGLASTRRLQQPWRAAVRTDKDDDVPARLESYSENYGADHHQGSRVKLKRDTIRRGCSGVP
jgi:hypothetical protein